MLNSKMWSDLGYIYASGSTRKRISRKNMEKLKAIYPPLSEQKKIASILSSVDAKIQKEEECKTKLEQLKKGLMQKLLTGEIRVNTEMEV
jgi:type I restriction enzyme S subunit